MGCLVDRTRRLGKRGRPPLSATRSTEGMLGYACALEGGGGERTLVREHGGTRQGGIELAAAAKRWIGIYYALDQSACGGGVDG